MWTRARRPLIATQRWLRTSRRFSVESSGSVAGHVSASVAEGQRPPLSPFPVDLLPNKISNWSGTAVDFHKLVLFEDDDVLVAYKPPTVLSMRTDTMDSSIVSMQSMAQSYLQNPKTVILKPLEVQAGGIVLFPKTSIAKASLRRQVNANRIGNQFLCIVHGEVPTGELCVDRVITRSQGNTLPRSKIASDDELEANTVLCVLTFAPIGDALELPNKDGILEKLSFITVDQHTSRKHQARVQLEFRSMPVVGDLLYGSPTKYPEGDLAMHGLSITFQHPSTKKWLRVTVEPPRIWSKRMNVDANAYAELALDD